MPNLVPRLDACPTMPMSSRAQTLNSTSCRLEMRLGLIKNALASVGNFRECGELIGAVDKVLDNTQGKEVGMAGRNGVV